MAKLTIVAHIRAKTGQANLVKAELEKLIDTTRAENGCLQYDLHEDNDNPAHFLFFENWDSREHWQKHMNNQHLKDYLTATEGVVEDFQLFEMTKIA
jgi:quinol monooxygenase YgiN